MAVAATAYSRLYVFGETLSDVRNLLAAAGIATPPANSGGFDGTFGPGNPVWAEDLAAHLGLSANSSTPGGSNVDVGSLPSNMDGVLPEGFNLPSLAAQIAAAGPVDPNGLYVVQGANAAVAAAAFSGATVIAGNAGGFTGAAISPLSFDNAPVIFGAPVPGGGFTQPQTDPNSDPSCTQDCSPPPTLVCVNLATCFPEPPTPNCGANCAEDQTQGPELCPDGSPADENGNCAIIQIRLPTIRIVSPAAVPEPTTLVVLTVGALGLLLLARQRRRPARVTKD